ncbi:MAG: peptidoglycan DD-metalloendopeptidase family protein [Candidatus Aminicenantales bacterium]
MKATSVQLRIEKRKKKRVVIVLYVATLLAGLVFFLLAIFHPKKEKTNALFRSTDALHEPPALIETKERFRPGDTMEIILTAYGLNSRQIHLLYEQTKPVYDLNLVRAGQELRIYASEQGQSERLEYDLDETNYLLIRWKKDKFIATLETHPLQKEVRLLGGIIKENPVLAFNEQGESDALALAFSEVFAWDVDFYVDIQPGDSFKVIFEKHYLRGKFIGYGNILAAELVNRGKKFQAFRFQPPGTQKSGYYDAEGNSLQKEFIKSPLKYARITSRFSRRRLHPIHKVYRAHHGVDYAAPIGTPVQATADGTVIYMGTNGASGRMVKIRHRNGYETMYLHLKGYGPGIRVGARVKSGDILGYVGSSGESTGPHLDYRITLRGSYINPLSWKFEPIEPLAQEHRLDFERSIQPYRLLLENPLLLIGQGLF